MIFLDKDDTSKHDSKLRQVLSSDKAQKASDQTNLAKAFCKSTSANAVLTIEQISEGGFDLKLIELPSLDIVGQGKSKRSRE